MQIKQSENIDVILSLYGTLACLFTVFYYFNPLSLHGVLEIHQGNFNAKKQ